MSCTALGTNPAIGEVLWCGIQMGAGGFVIATLLIFLLLLYGMYKFRLPFEAALPLGIFLAFVFAGAGNTTMMRQAGGLGIFVQFLLISFLVVGGIAAMLLWRFGKR